MSVRISKIFWEGTGHKYSFKCFSLCDDTSSNYKSVLLSDGFMYQHASISSGTASQSYYVKLIIMKYFNGRNYSPVNLTFNKFQLQPM